MSAGIILAGRYSAIKGADLKITRLSIEKGEADIDGSVDSVIYSQIKNYGEKGKSVLKRMFS